jgi:hypothetical protein
MLWYDGYDVADAIVIDIAAQNVSQSLQTDNIYNIVVVKTFAR